MGHPSRKGLRRTGYVLLFATLLFSFLGSIALTGHDETGLRSFAEAVDRWQVNPEFRAVALDYCVHGSAATRVHLL